MGKEGRKESRKERGKSLERERVCKIVRKYNLSQGFPVKEATIQFSFLKL